MSIPMTAKVFVYVVCKCPYCGYKFDYYDGFDPITDSVYWECEYCGETMLIESPF